VQDLVAASAHGIQDPAAAAAHELPGLAAEQEVGRGLIAERFRHPGAVAASVFQPERPVDAALDAAYPAALGFSSQAFPAFPAEQVRVAD
jgi:hypothetical protein